MNRRDEEQKLSEEKEIKNGREEGKYNIFILFYFTEG